MRPQLVALVLLSTAGACSLIYNPNNLGAPNGDAPDVPGDRFIGDADPSMLSVEDVGPHVLLEGQGAGGSRPAILAIRGHHFVDGVQVQLIAPGGEPVMFVVDNLNIVVAPGRDVIAVPVSLPVDVARGAGTVQLWVKVTQGAFSRTLEGKLELRNLNELEDTAVTDSALLEPLYSRIIHPTLITFAVTPNKPPAVFRAVSSIVLGDITANATAAAAGPGGGIGGAVGSPGAGLGGGQPGSVTGGAGGAGFSSAGAMGAGTAPGAGGILLGEPRIKSYATNHGSGGGGGSGSVGGGSGGTVEISAGGTVRVGRIEVNGANAAAGGVSGGGGGAGGVVVIRAGASAELAGPISATPGAGSTGTGLAGGTGRSGRIRIDVPLVIGSPPITPPAHLGMSLDPTTPRSTRTLVQPVTAYGTLGDTFNVFVLDAAGTSTSQSVATFATPTIKINPTLSEGYNRICVTPNTHVAAEESTNCIDVAYAP